LSQDERAARYAFDVPPLLVSDMPSWFVSVMAFVFGACWGSFFNVAIYRWPLGLSVVTPASHCPSCQARIPPWLNMPIVGYLALRGRTACCGTPLSPRYPIVEALGGALGVAVTQQVFGQLDEATPLIEACLLAATYFAFAGGLLVATFVDLEHMEIPDEVSLPGTALGLITASFRMPLNVADAALGAGAGFLFVQVLFVWGYELLTGRRGMGEGDSKLLMMIGAFLGWQGAAFALVAGALQGLVVALIAIVRGYGKEELAASAAAAGEAAATGAAPEGATVERGADDDEEDDDPPPAWLGHLKLPFGPFLALGALEHMFFGDYLIERWMSAAASLARMFPVGQ
jgi:leader peptidase (prepilin peptidase)/N-methyltransferase